MDGSAGPGNQGTKEDESGERVHERGHGGISSSVTFHFTLHSLWQRGTERPIKGIELLLSRRGGLTVEEKPSFCFEALLPFILCVSVCWFGVEKLRS